MNKLCTYANICIRIYKISFYIYPQFKHLEKRRPFSPRLVQHLCLPESPRQLSGAVAGSTLTPDFVHGSTCTFSSQPSFTGPEGDPLPGQGFVDTSPHSYKLHSMTHFFQITLDVAFSLNHTHPLPSIGRVSLSINSIHYITSFGKVYSHWE